MVASPINDLLLADFTARCEAAHMITEAWLREQIDEAGKRYPHVCGDGGAGVAVLAGACAATGAVLAGMARQSDESPIDILTYAVASLQRGFSDAMRNHTPGQS